MLMDNSNVFSMHMLLQCNMIIKVLTKATYLILLGIIGGSRPFNYPSSASFFLLPLENEVTNPTNQVLIICGEGEKSSYLAADKDAHVVDAPQPLIMFLRSAMGFLL